jgi:hypothetical protein
MTVRTFLVVTLVTLLIWLWAEVSNHASRGRESMAWLTLSRVPVLVAASPELLAKAVPTPDATELRDVTIVGPRTLIEAVRAGSLKVWASATLEPGDAPDSQPGERPVDFPVPGSAQRVRLALHPGGLGLAWGVAGEEEPMPPEAAPSVLVRVEPRRAQP